MSFIICNQFSLASVRSSIGSGHDRADITLSSQERMFGERQLPVTQDDITTLQVLLVDGLLLGLRLSMPGVYGLVTS
jgi:hypothetical protein